MKRVYEVGEADLQMHTFMLEECMKLNLRLLGTQFFGCIGKMDLKVFLYRNKDIDKFRADIKELKKRCQEIIDTYINLDIKISFFETSIEEEINYKGFSKSIGGNIK